MFTDILSLLVSFLQVGLFSIGGGYATLPFIQKQVVDLKGWLTTGELTDMITISQMTPGPLAVNISTFVGVRIAGIGGAVAARDVGHEEVGIPAAAEAFGRVGKPDAAQRDVLARLAPHEEAFASGTQVGIGMEVVVHNRAPEELK